MIDAISRQAAIEAIKKDMHADTDWLMAHIFDGIEELLNSMPSAEPEIIRCKDCKHKHLENMVWTCPFGLPAGENFFCGYAERRTDETC